MAEKRKRVSYTAEHKLRVVAKAEEVGNREAGRIFQVDEKSVRQWRTKKEELAKMGKRQRSKRHGKPSWPVLEENLHRWILAQRQDGVPLSTVKIRMKAKVMAAETGIVNFQGGPSWCERFRKRKKLCVRARTTVGQRLPADWEQKMENFRTFTRNVIKEENFLAKQIINMDEVPLSFDCPPNRTVDIVGSKTVSIETTGHEKSNMTVVLGCAADGSKLKPMIIFKRKTWPKKEEFPPGVCVQVNEKGWMNQGVMQTWLEEVWRKREGAFFNPAGLLIFDSMKAHLDEGVKEMAGKKNFKAKLSVIPGGLTKKLQPLDISVNRSFKAKVRGRWEDWMCAGLHSYTKSGNMKRASLSEVARWVKESWDEVSSKTVRAGFRKAGISETVDQEEESEESESEACDAVTPVNVAELPPEILELFRSDSEDSDFEGFE